MHERLKLMPDIFYRISEVNHRPLHLSFGLDFPVLLNILKLVTCTFENTVVVRNLNSDNKNETRVTWRYFLVFFFHV